MLPYKNLLKVDGHSKKPVYEQLAAGLHRLINNGIIQPGTRLPSSRVMADLLQLHRKTVMAAYEELILQGWITARNKSGYYVNAEVSVAGVPPKKTMTPRYPAKSPVPLQTDAAKLSTLIGRPRTIFLDDGLPERRMKLLPLAHAYNFIILEDDYDYDFHYISSHACPWPATITRAGWFISAACPKACHRHSG
ncbi:GntR family transcriptional regulator [Chitinophaga horti]|uniref:GntR family transcriptional regulator n=1 Tax=Chitinophaga horti TaxID=2920382 RepID=A0ABY6IUS7_9BACT|nr:GntR family transcriptional regulator [Chitinophaga horti]UYQ91130.1 GntR family transcriptional regulator [Chitinophaga horti]